MRPFTLSWREVVTAAAIFAVVILAFAILSSVAGWPSATSGWPLAVGVALALALLRALGPALDFLQEAGAKIETPFLKLDFAGATRIAGNFGQPWILSDDLIRRSPSVPESSLGELERSVQDFVNQPEIVIDLEDGGAWYKTRIFAVAATAVVVGSPSAIVLIGQRNTLVRQFGGWIRPENIVLAFERRNQHFVTIHQRALQYLAHLRLHGDDPAYAAPSSFPRYAQYVGQFGIYGDTAIIRILVDQMLNPEGSPQNEPLEPAQQPPWIDLGDLERILQPWLVCDHVQVELNPKEQVLQILGSSHEFIARTKDGEFVGMIDASQVQRDIVRQLVARASV